MDRHNKRCFFLYKSKTKAKIAQQERIADMTKDASHKASDIDAISQNQKNMAQNITLFLSLVPIILAFVGYDELVVKGFEALSIIPDWYLIAVGVMLGCTWGLRRIF